jgi:predicted acyltransferase (DUF342 family)
MMFSNNAFCFFLVLAAAYNVVKAVKEAKFKISNHPELRGGSPTPAESLADADSRMLGVEYPVGFLDVKGTWVGDWAGADQTRLSVQAGDALVFTGAATTISSGDVCGYAAITGLKDRDYFLGHGASFINGCNPDASSINGESMADLLIDALAIQQDTSPLGALALDSDELGGRTILPGVYKTDSSITVAAGTIVTLYGNDESKFLFLSGGAVVTGADTTFNLVPDGEGNGPPQAENILFVSAGATHTGASSVLEGSILSGAAITLGAGSEVAGVVFAKEAITVGSGCAINKAQVQSPLYTMLNSERHFGTVQPQPTVSLNGASLDDLLIDALAIQQASSSLGALLLVSGEVGGLTILPGAYKTDSSITVAAGTVVTLQGNADSRFLFLSGASVVTGADTIFNLVPGDKGKGPPQAKNILFVSAGATTTGANSVLAGSILSGAAITLGAGSEVDGGIFAKAAITVGAGCEIEGSILSGAAITLGAASEVTGGIFAKAAITVGVGCTHNSEIDEAEVQSSVNNMVDNRVPVGQGQPQPTDDLLTDALSIQKALALVSGELGGLTILPGAYKTDTSITVAAGTVVTLQGNADSKYIFLSGASVVTGADTIFNLVPDGEGKGPPQANNIVFVSAGASTTGANSVLEGSILSGAAMTLGAGSEVDGGIFAKAAVTVGAGCAIEGSILSGAALTLGAASEVTGGIFAKAAITLGAGCAYNNAIKKVEVQSPVYIMLNSEVPIGPGQPQLTGV